MFADLATVLTALEYRTLLPVVNIKSFISELFVVFTAEYTHATHRAQLIQLKRLY